MDQETNRNKLVQDVLAVVESDVSRLEREIIEKRKLLDVLRRYPDSSTRAISWPDFLQWVEGRDEFLVKKLRELRVTYFGRNRLEFTGAASTVSFVALHKGKLQDLCKEYTGERVTLKRVKEESYEAATARG